MFCEYKLFQVKYRGDFRYQTYENIFLNENVQFLHLLRLIHNHVRAFGDFIVG